MAGLSLPKEKAIAVLLFVLLICTGVFAQTATTAIYGQITDPQGAAIVGAKITITHTGTGAVRSATSDGTGSYKFSALAPGTYLLQVEMTGFRVARFDKLELLVNTTTKYDVRMEVGAQNQVVEVNAAAEALNTTDASIGHAFGELQIKTLPMEARNVVGLLALQPGALYVPKPTTSAGQDNDPRNGSISGSHSDQSNVTLDGVDANDPQFGYSYTSVLRMTLDSVQEFRVTTTNYGADQGRSSAAQVSMITKGGTNQFHGSAYYYNRNTAFSSNDWFAKLNEAQNGQPNKRPTLNKHIGGASLGGPIFKDRLFFFANWEMRRDSSASPVYEWLPSETLRDGIVVYKCAVAANCPGGQVTGAQNTHVIPAGYYALTPANLATLDPLGIGPGAAVLQYFNQYPVPNDPGRDGIWTSAGVVGNTVGYRFNSPIKTKLYTYIAKLDYHLDHNGNHTLFWRGNLQNDHYNGAEQFPGQGPSRTTLDNSRGLALGYTAVLSPTKINNFRYGYTRLGNANAGLTKTDTVSFRNIDPFVAQTYTNWRHIPTHNFVDDFTWNKGAHTVQFGGNVRISRIARSNDAYAYNDAYINSGWASGSGKAYMPGGGCGAPCDAFPSVLSGFQSSYAESFINILGVMSEADAYYNYLKDGTVQPTGMPVLRTYGANEMEIYGQDTWRLRHNLTLTLGLRYGIASPPWEVNGLQAAPTVSLGDWMKQRGELAMQGIPGNTLPPLQFDLAGKANGKKGFYNTQYNNFSPRLSFAWNPHAKSGLLKHLFGDGGTVLRGGYAKVYDHIGMALATRFTDDGMYGFSKSLSSPSSEPYETMPGIRFVNISTMPPHMPAPPVFTGWPQTPPDLFQIANGMDSNITTPYAHMYNFMIGRQLTSSMTLEMGYVGRQGRNLLVRQDLGMYQNFVDPTSHMDYFTAARQVIAAIQNIPAGNYRNTALFTNIPSIAFFENLWPTAAGTYRGNVLTATQAIAREFYYYNPDWSSAFAEFDNDGYPDYSRFGPDAFWSSQFSSLGGESSIGRSEYHSLQVTLRKRMSQGLDFTLNYALSKSSDLASQNERGSFFNPWKNGGYTGFLMNSWDPNQSWAPSDFDVRHQVNLNWTYELPVGRKQRFGSGLPAAVNAVIGNWQVSGVYRWNTGYPFSIQNCASCWPTNWELQGNAMLKDPSQTPPLGTTLNAVNGYPSPFKDPAAAVSYFRYALPGEAGLRNNFRGDRYINVDLGLGKAWTMPYKESHLLKFRWEIFNVTNTPSFDVNGLSANPDVTSSFGKYQYTINGCDNMANRCMQMSLRYEF